MPNPVCSVARTSGANAEVNEHWNVECLMGLTVMSLNMIRCLLDYSSNKQMQSLTIYYLCDIFFG